MTGNDAIIIFKWLYSVNTYLRESSKNYGQNFADSRDKVIKNIHNKKKWKRQNSNMFEEFQKNSYEKQRRKKQKAKEKR